MPLLNYAELLTEFEAYLDRTDYSARFPTFVRLVESDVQKSLDNEPEMIGVSTVVSSGRFTALPTDFGGMVSVNAGRARLASVTTSDFGAYETQSGDPSVFAVIGNRLAMAPSNTTATIELIYKRNIPALTVAAPTNWLMTRAPEIYLYGTLLHAHAYGWEDARLPLFQGAYQDALNTLRIDGERRQWGAAPLAPRIRRT